MSSKVGTMINDAKRKKTEEAKGKSELINKTLKRAFTNVTSDEDGLIAIRYIMEQSGWLSDLIVGSPESGDIHDRGTLYNNARRILYKQLRQFIPIRALKRIEFEKTKYRGDDENDL